MNNVETSTTVHEYVVNTFYTKDDGKIISTFSVTGNRSSTAHTGLGTMLRSSGSSPYTSPNCQVGLIPKQLTNYTKVESKFICIQSIKLT